MSYENVNIYVKDDTSQQGPVPNVIVRVFDETGTYFITQSTSDSAGVAALLLPAPQRYQLRFFKDRFSIQQPQFLDVLEAPILPQTNDFNAVGHIYSPPEAVHPRMCRCSGFFKRPNNAPAIGHDVHFIAKFDPLLFESDAMLTERLMQRTDERGYMEIDLVRFGQYNVTVEGFEDCTRVITIPDAASVNLPDLLFPVVERVTFAPDGPWVVAIDPLNDVEVTPTVWTSDGRVLPGTALEDVRWASSDPNVFAVLATNAKLFLRGLAPGTAQLTASRADVSIVRIPNTPIEGVPVSITVA